MPNGPNPPKPSMPGTEHVSSWISFHTGLVQKHLDTLNQVWADITNDAATAQTWAQGYGKLLATWTENAKSLFSFYAGQTRGGTVDGAPLVTFVADSQAENVSQGVPVSADVSANRVKFTKLLSLRDGAPLQFKDNNGVLQDKTFDAPIINMGALTVALSGLQTVPNASKVGGYWSAVYEECPPLAAGGAPPRRVLALVLLTFV